ncbi:sirohydrochlorin cobaltochelatase [Halosquirtibacter xylanolyticus]|uniref:sirohydrochlorin cobaltochelatase n=1 Tax=Halosquirtibacter xylanolyticus TaxID=3374599 RepID=UPI003747E66D|nr:sirohydrochlorin cobaltochelatase [Prolixibacteraceae bacterium]
MKTVLKSVMIFSLILGIFTSCSKDDDNVVVEKKNADKTAILLASFGSSYKGPEATLMNIKEEVAKANPDAEIRWAFTSYIIRNILIKRENSPFKNVDSPEEALTKLIKEGYSKIAVQSLHLIPGLEYNDVKKLVDDLDAKHKNVKITLGTPLMNTDEDMKELVEIMVGLDDLKGKTVLMMGHGSTHAANDRYTRVGDFFKAKDPKFIVGTVEAKPDVIDVITKLEALKLQDKNITLIPLMSVAGDHASNDMAGDDKYSWKPQLEKAGYTVNLVRKKDVKDEPLKGLGDYDSVVAIWVKHLNAVVKALK